VAAASPLLPAQPANASAAATVAMGKCHDRRRFGLFLIVPSLLVILVYRAG
jgi:hypothetical protein